VKGAQNLDYIAIWFLKACIYSKDKLNVKSAFVSTNSIVQGVQVATLWPLIFKSKLDIFSVTLLLSGQTMQNDKLGLRM
jgi:hypothetical protein